VKIYISGPITGTKDYMERFAKAEAELKAEGHEVINPAEVNSSLPKGTTHKEYMEVAMTLLKMCDCVFMLRNWVESHGAMQEFNYAVAHDYFIRFEAKEPWKRAVEFERKDNLRPGEYFYEENIYEHTKGWLV
jgi:nucleoside 2-deoxyribosyltransferase